MMDPREYYQSFMSGLYDYYDKSTIHNKKIVAFFKFFSPVFPII